MFFVVFRSINACYVIGISIYLPVLVSYVFANEPDHFLVSFRVVLVKGLLLFPEANQEIIFCFVAWQDKIVYFKEEVLLYLPDV